MGLVTRVELELTEEQSKLFLRALKDYTSRREYEKEYREKHKEEIGIREKTERWKAQHKVSNDKWHKCNKSKFMHRAGSMIMITEKLYVSNKNDTVQNTSNK